MTKKAWLSPLLLAVFMGVGGCRTAPIHNVRHSPVEMNKADYSLEDVGKAIFRAGNSLGWQMKIKKPGTMIGTLYQDSHMAQVAIDYNTREYDITYQASKDLNYQAGKIHKNYNGWIEELDQAIHRELLSEM